MKRTFLSLLLVVLLANVTPAQIVEHSVGLRYGAVYGLGTEISYQRGLTARNRLEFDLGFNSRFEYINDMRQDYNSWALTGLYHWVWKLDNQLSWYAGSGAKLGIWSSSQKYDSRYKNGMFMVAVGDVGIEYALPSRIQFALDALPEIGLFNNGIGVNIGFSIRYQLR